jgi:glycosyltransferase involved in cell wall biosynthesis
MLSIVIPVRNRSGARLENCLKSLRWQDGTEPFEIVISDYGSSPEIARELDDLAAKYGARVVHSAAPGVWNRSHALNIGIRAAAGEHVLCTDADMIFAPSFVAAVQRRLEKARVLVVCECRNLPESVPEQPWEKTDFPRLLAASTWRKAGTRRKPHSMGTGACQAAERAFFERVRGYDEQYLAWGCEDGDMLSRALEAGLTLEWIHEETSMLHQWHPTVRRARRWLYYKNKLRMTLTRKQIVKNHDRWGTAPAV